MAISAVPDSFMIAGLLKRIHQLRDSLSAQRVDCQPNGSLAFQRIAHYCRSIKRVRCVLIQVRTFGQRTRAAFLDERVFTFRIYEKSRDEVPHIHC